MRGPTLALAAILILPLAGCGGSGHDRIDPEKLLEQAAAHPIRSAQLDVDATLRLNGTGALAEPLHVHFEGPYASNGAGTLPSFDWRVNASALSFPVGGRLVSTGDNVHLTVYGNRYEVGEGEVAGVNAQLAEATSSGPALSPDRWLIGPTVVGEGSAGGVDCELISGGPRWELIADELGALTGAAGSAAPAISGHATVCIGYDDRALHGLDLNAQLTFPPEARRRLGGASTARIEADIEISEVGEGQRIATPHGRYRPLRDLLLTLNDLGVPIPLG